MKDESKELNIHHPSPSDLERVHEFMNACDFSEYGEPDSDLEELSDQWGEVDLAKDAWLAADDSGVLTGYALLSQVTEGKRFLDLYINQVQSPQGVENVLLDLALARYAELRGQAETSDAVGITAYMTGVNTRCQSAFSARGFRVENYHYRMQIDFTEPVAMPDWPEGYTLGHFNGGGEQELYDLLYTAFTGSGLRLGGFESWKKKTFGTARFEPELFLTLRQAGKLVGAVVSYDEDTRGWIRQLAVVGDLQGQGVGSRLLKTIFAIFQQRGLPTVALGVSSKNENAYRIYEHNGMHRSRVFLQYHLDPIK